MGVVAGFVIIIKKMNWYCIGHLSWSELQLRRSFLVYLKSVTPETPETPELLLDSTEVEEMQQMEIKRKASVLISMVIFNFFLKCKQTSKLSQSLRCKAKKKTKRNKRSKKRPLLQAAITPIDKVVFALPHVVGDLPWTLRLADVIRFYQHMVPTKEFDVIEWSNETYWKANLAGFVKRSLIRPMSEEARYRIVKLWTVVLPEFRKWLDVNWANKAMLVTVLHRMQNEKHPLRVFRSGFFVLKLGTLKNVCAARVGQWAENVALDGGMFLPYWSSQNSNLGTRGIFSVPIVVEFECHQSGATTPVFIDLNQLPFSKKLPEWVAFCKGVLLRYSLVIRHAVLHRWVKPFLKNRGGCVIGASK